MVNMNGHRQNVGEPILLRGEEVAELLGVSRAKAYRLMQHQEIPAIRFGKTVRCPRESLLSFIQGRTLQPAEMGILPASGEPELRAIS
jgi:excisionase family DNA binding protein